MSFCADEISNVDDGVVETFYLQFFALTWVGYWGVGVSFFVLF